VIKSFAGLAAVFVAALAGCAPMCQSPWDYCNAVLGGNGTPNCNFGARYNSQFVPMNGTPPTTPIQPTPAAAKQGETEAPQPLEAPSDRSDLYEDLNSPLPE
jgi:hypothetical protein